MSDRYAFFTQTPVGKLAVKNLGLPNPVPLDRWTEGAPLVDGTVLVGGAGRLAETPDHHARRPGHHRRVRVASRAPATRAWSSTPPASPPAPAWSRSRSSSPPCSAASRAVPASSCSVRRRSRPRGGERVAQRALEGFTRSPGQGDRQGLHRPARLRRARAPRRPSPRRWPSCSRRSRPTSPARSSASAPPAPPRPLRSATGPDPLEGKVALVTGASRGIGEQIARVLHRDGATVLGIDVPAGGQRAAGGDEGDRRRQPDPRHHALRRARSGSRTTCRPSTAASTSSCTTPASPATRSWPT